MKLVLVPFDQIWSIILSMNKDHLLYILGINADVYETYIRYLGDKGFRFEDEENSGLSGRGIFALPYIHELTLISPIDIDPEFIADAENLLGRKIKVFSPEKTAAAEIARDVLNDPQLFKTLSKIVPQAMLGSYTPSPELYVLIEALRETVGEVELKDLPPQYSEVAFLEIGGKAGIRRFMDRYRDDPNILHMVDGEICKGRESLIRETLKKYHEWKRVVVKTKKAHAGAAVLKYPEGYNLKDLEKALRIDLVDEYWDKQESVVERYIDIDEKVAGGNPNAEFTILEDGTIQHEYFCGMIVKGGAVFSGVLIDPTILNLDQQDQIYQTGLLIGEYLASTGYRGKFELDCMACKEGNQTKIYLTEVNVRRNGGTEVYETAKYLNGGTLDGIVVYSENNAPISNSKDEKIVLSYSEIKRRLHSELYNPQSKHGIIITNAELAESGTFGYMIIESDTENALKRKEQMFALLRAA
jgi:hypothetical protein